jgi:hypothetical protein
MSSAKNSQPLFDAVPRQAGYADQDAPRITGATDQRGSEGLSFSLRVKPDRRRVHMPVPPERERRRARR